MSTLWSGLHESLFFTKYDLVGRMIHPSRNGTAVYYGSHIKKSDGEIAVKFIPRPEKYTYHLNGEMVPSEIFFLAKAQSVPGVVKLYEWFTLDSAFVIVMEKPKRNSDLSEYLKDNKKGVEEILARHIFKQLLSIVEGLKELNIVHRAIRCENVLINEKTLKITLIDFANAAPWKKEPFLGAVGTPTHSPPEMLDKYPNYHSEPLTCWTLAELLFNLLFKQDPFKGNRKKCTVSFPKHAQVITAECEKLIISCLDGKTSKRLTLTQIATCEWLRMRL